MAMVDDPAISALADLMDPASDGLPDHSGFPRPDELEFETFAADYIICQLEMRRTYPSTWLTLNLQSLPASIERYLHPDLAGFPLIVCDPAQRGVVFSAADVCGRALVPGMALLAALSLVPDAVAVVADFAKYSEFRSAFEVILSAYDPAFTFSGLSSVSLEVSACCDERGLGPWEIAREIRAAFAQVLEFPLKIGIGGSRIASQFAAACDGDISVAPSARFAFLRFVGSAPIAAIPGLSPTKRVRLRGLGIETVGQIIENRALISFHFQEAFAFWLFSAALGIDHYFAPRALSLEKQIPATAAFAELSGHLRRFCEKLSVKVGQSGVPVRFLKIGFGAGERKARYTALPYSSMEFCDIYAAAGALLKGEHEADRRPISRLKIAVSERPFSREPKQLSLGKWLGAPAERPRTPAPKRGVLEDFFAAASGSQEVVRPRPAPKFRPKRSASAKESGSTQRRLTDA
jgi:nucleotidyltransferase/DNA polymerase involved in DNA repair